MIEKEVEKIKKEVESNNPNRGGYVFHEGLKDERYLGKRKEPEESYRTRI